MKILITGGHMAPALAVIEELSKDPDHKIQIVFVGKKYALDTEKTLSLEYKEITKLGIPFIPLQTGRLTRIFSTKTVRSLLRVPLGFLNALTILRKERPDAVLTFGGYLALPIAFWSAVLRISLYTHEQTLKPGLANRIIGLMARKVFLAFDQSKKYFNPHKTITTGNPVRKSIFSIQKKPFEVKKDLPILYVTGGSLGSHSVNMHISHILETLLKKYIVIHQVGDTKEYNDFDRLSNLRETYPENLKNRYFLAKHFFEDEMGYIYSIADLIIGRSGANTFFELIALHKPAIFIPLPWSANHEQEEHARLFQKAGVGEIFFQTEPSENLTVLIDTMIKDLNRYRENFNMLRYLYHQNESEKIIAEITGGH